jgi:hypothetical protein
MPCQGYLLHELAADMHSGHNVHSPVFIEARAMYRVDGPEEMRPVGEVEFAQVTTRQRHAAHTAHPWSSHAGASDRSCHALGGHR